MLMDKSCSPQSKTFPAEFNAITSRRWQDLSWGLLHSYYFYWETRRKAWIEEFGNTLSFLQAAASRNDETKIKQMRQKNVCIREGKKASMAAYLCYWDTYHRHKKKNKSYSGLSGYAALQDEEKGLQWDGPIAHGMVKFTWINGLTSFPLKHFLFPE